MLRDKGFDVDTPEFAMTVFSVDKESLSVNGKPFEAHAIEYSGASPAGALRDDLWWSPGTDTWDVKPGTTTTWTSQVRS